MKKSFKKAIAVLLAVLMVAFSVPFTAFAAPGDYEPDVELMFGTFHADAAAGWQDYSAPAGSTFDYCGLYDVPLEYDRAAGTLTMSAAKAAKADEILGYGAPSEDYVYGVGDYFTVTVVMENVQTVFAAMNQIKYSENIEPAGYWTKSGRPATYGLGSVSEVAANGGTMTIGGTTPLTNMSAGNFYSTINILGDLSVMNTENHYFEQEVAASNTATDVSVTHDDYFADPNTGDLSTGYTYTNTCIMQTWVFKIVDEGPIVFEPYDPYNELSENHTYEGGYLVASMDDGIMTSNYTTYAFSYGGPNASSDPAAGDENPGSTKMTIFGENLNIATPEPPAEHVHTYSQVTTDPTCTEDGYITFTCNNEDGLGTEGDDVYTEGADLHPELAATGHDYQVTEDTTSSCTVKGYTVYTCANCGDTYTVYKELADHTPVADESTAVAATCTKDGKEADTVCAVCGITLEEGAVISAIGHDFDTNGDGIVDEDDGVVTTEAKCEEDGVRTYTCTRNCGEEGYTYTEVIPATGHIPDEDNPVVTIIKEQTCTEKGYKNTTVTCAVCGKVLSSVDEELDELGHDFVEGETVAPTISEDGYTVYTCSRCGEIELRDIVPALGINVTVLPSDLGTATINGNNVVTDAVTVNVAEKADVVLTATPVKGAHFVGWNVDGKLVYTEADITVKALANITYEPVFEVAGDEFTVVFTDKYGNVFNTQTVTSGADIVVPDAPVVTGYNFVGWSVDDIAGLTTSATINAKYERIADDTYTVTAPGCTIATPYTTAEDVNSGISYDTLVTVTAPNATAWKVDNATVAYGESYSFYVGADVTVVAVFDDTVTAVPTVAAVTPEGVAIGTPGQIKASFLATRSMTDDCTYVNAGFVYALNPAANTITLADVNDSTVLASYCATDAEQFCLNIGRISQTGTIVARAFLAYVDASGVTQVIYAEPQSFTY